VAPVLALGAAAVACGLLARFLPLDPEDPFRGTLVLLPLLLAGAAALDRWTAAQGGRRIPGWAVAGELAALAGLLVLVLAQSRFRLAGADEPLAAGLLLVLAHRVARQLLAARPLLGRRLPQRPSAVFFFLPLLAYLAILPWSTGHRQPDGDEPYYLLITHSLAYDLDADLTNNYADEDWRFFMDRPIEPQPGDPVGPRGQKYSRHNEMLPLALVPAYRAAGKLGALATMAALTALLAWATLRLARHYFPERPGEALAAYALMAFTPPLLLYSYQVWVEVPAALLAFLALDRMMALDGRRWGWKEWLGIGLPVLLLPLVKIRFMLIAAPLLVMGWFYAGKPRLRMVVLGGLLAGVAGGILLYNQSLYSNPLKIHSWQELDPYSYSPTSYLAGGLGFFFDTAFGLFGAAPVWMLVLPATLLLLARRSRLLLHLALLSLPYVLIVAPRNEWYGGWSPPFRYALIALPLLAIALVPLLAHRHRPGARALLAGLGVLTVVLTLVWIAVPGWTYNFADGRTYALDRLGERLGMDVARFFPSSVRLRPATWLWPPLALAGISLLWWLPSRPRWRPVLSRAGVAGLAGPTGIIALLAVTALLPAAAARMPTATVEVEDPQVRKSGGHLHPDRWVIERTRYRGGWVLRVGEKVEVPVVAGGDRVRLTIDAELIRNQPFPYTLDLKAGDRLLASWTPARQRVWTSASFGPFPWRDGEPLVLEARGAFLPDRLESLNGAILDRVRFDWR
jgi:hypothetical protein